MWAKGWDCQPIAEGYNGIMSAAATIAPCLEMPNKMPTSVTKPTPVVVPVKPWISAEKLAEINSKQRLMSWEEKKAQINRSLGRPLDSD